jgi:hypothetical protein
MKSMFYFLTMLLLGFLTGCQTTQELKPLADAYISAQQNKITEKQTANAESQSPVTQPQPVPEQPATNVVGVWETVSSVNVLSDIKIEGPKYFQFHSVELNENCGMLWWNDGTFYFEGKADESAKVFFEYLKQYIDPYIAEKLKDKEQVKQPVTNVVGVGEMVDAANDLDEVTDWLDMKEVKDFKMTVNLSVSLSGNKLKFRCDRMDWPSFVVKKPVNGNIWVILKKDGKTYAGTFEYFAGKSFEKSISVLTDMAYDHINGYNKIIPWQWQPGEEIGIFLTAGNPRAGKVTVKERTNVVRLKL